MSFNTCPSADDAFGPVVAQSCASFDFTLTFEQSILSIVPSVILLLLVPQRVVALWKADVKTTKGYPIWGAKPIAILIYIILQLVLLILWAAQDVHRTSTTIPAAVLGFVAAVSILQLSYLSHTRSVRPSTVLNLYLLTSLLLDLPQARTLFIRDTRAGIAAVFVAGMAARVMILALEAQDKTACLDEKYREYPPEATLGVISRTMLFWLNPLFVKGVKGLLCMDDLFTMDPTMGSEMLRHTMREVWEKRAKPETRFSLPKACIKALRWPLFYIFPPRIALIGFTYAQPFLITATISYVSHPRADRDSNDGLGLVAAAALVYFGIAVATVGYRHQLYRSITMLRGALVGVIYSRTLDSPDGLFDESAAVTLMSTDIDRIAQSMITVNEIWANTAEVTIGVGLLERQLGAVCVIPILLVLICAVVNTRSMNAMSNRQRVWNAAVQRRIAMTSAMLGSIKSVKMMGLASFMMRSIQGQRNREIGMAKGFRWMVMTTNTNSNIPTIFAPILTIIAYTIEARVRGNGPLSTNQAFTSLAIITLMTSPAQDLLGSIRSTAACMGCFERIQEFLLAPNRSDERRVLDGSQKAPSSNAPTIGSDAHELKDLAPKSSLKLSSESSLAISIKELTVKPSPSSEPALVDVSVDFGRGTLNIITGPVGSGKTTLMRAILGELAFTKGDITIYTTDIAYCSQSAWVTNTTVKKTICGLSADRDVEEKWYDTVMHACALDLDVQGFPNGDQSVIGNRGIILSGGQKQRVALARAVYARKSMVILDDVLSALDSKTEKLIATRLLGPAGLFRKLGTTVILVTHSTAHFDIADQIVVLGSDKSIAQQGSFQDLRNEEGYIGALLLHPVISNAIDAPATTDAPKKRAFVSGATAAQFNDLTRRTGDIAVYKYYFKSVGWPGALAFLLASAIYVFSKNFPQIWLKWWTEAEGRQLGKYISVYIILGISALVFLALSLYLILIYIAPKSSSKLHYTLLKTTINAPQSYFNETDIGTTLNRFSQDMGLIDRNLPISSMLVISLGYQCIVQIGLISQGSSFMATTIPAILILVYILQKLYLLTSRQLRFMDLEERSPVYTHFLETLEGLSTIRAFGWERPALSTNDRLMDLSQRPYYLLYCIQRWLNLVLDLMVAGLAIIVVVLAVKLSGATNGASIGIALNSVLGFTASLSRLVDQWTQLETSLGGIARMKNFEETIRPEDGDQPLQEPPANWPSQGAVEIMNVSASYDDKVKVLRDVSLSILPGQKVGICGRTGSGKSSLLMTILRLLDMQTGRIVIDNLDIAGLRRNRVREGIIAIPQEPFMLNETVRVNADPEGLHEDKAIIEVLGKVSLWEPLEARGGLDAQIRNRPLSHGQQQLFCLARAMLCKGKILVLDEATSNVDAETDQLMQKIIRTEFKEHTIITIAHRLNTILDADIVVVLEEGELVESGAPGELLGREGSRFRDMHRR